MKSLGLMEPAGLASTAICVQRAMCSRRRTARLAPSLCRPSISLTRGRSFWGKVISEVVVALEEPEFGLVALAGKANVERGFFVR